MPTVDTDVLVLLMSYVCQFYEKWSHFEIYAHMVNSSCQYYDIIAAIKALETETCAALPSLYEFTGCFEFLLQGKAQGVGCVAAK